MNCGSLFSGIGGLDHGLARAGFRHVFFAESDPWRREVLRARWPGVPVYDDVRDVGHRGGRAEDERLSRGGHGDSERRDDVHAGQGIEARGRPDLLCGGFPCQDLSVAGNRAGLAGNRSGLFYEFARIAESLRPRWLLLENVPGLFSSNGGRDFGAVIGTLADLGYGVGWRVLDSRYFGVPQRRRRVFIVGTESVGDPRAAAERAGQVLAVGTRCDRHPATRGETRENPAVASLCGLGSGGPDDNDGQAGRLVAETVRSHPRPGSNSNGNLLVADTLTSGSHPGSNMPGRREDDVNLVTAFNWQAGPGTSMQISETEVGSLVKEKAPAGHRGQTVRRLTPTECERLQALPDGWTQLDDKTPDSRRYAGLGDAVTASVAEWIGQRIMTAHLAAKAAA